MSALRESIEEFFVALSEASGEHDEISDTEVRDALVEVLHYHFVWGREVERTPVSFRLMTPDGNAAVAGIVEEFLDGALDMAEREDLAVGQPRLDALQDESLDLPEGESYDLYIGHADEPLPAEPPSEDLYEKPEYEDFADVMSDDADEDEDDEDESDGGDEDRREDDDLFD